MITYPVPLSPWSKDRGLATTPVQSSRLLRAGLSRKTSDMSYLVRVEDPFKGPIAREKQHGSLCDTPYHRKSDTCNYLPAWSLAALMRVAGGSVIEEGIEAGVKMDSPEALRQYLVGWILIAISTGELDPGMLTRNTLKRKI